MKHAGCRAWWPTPTVSPGRPCEGNVRLYRKKIEAGEMTTAEAQALLNGKDPWSAQGKVPAMLPTPSATDYKGSVSLESANQRAKEYKRGVRLPKHLTKTMQIEVGGKLNPPWVAWLMGWPIGWTDCEPLEMAKFQLWLRSHGEF